MTAISNLDSQSFFVEGNAARKVNAVYYQGVDTVIGHWTGVWALARHGTVTISGGILTLRNTRGKIINEAAVSEVSVKLGRLSGNAIVRMNGTKYFVQVEGGEPFTRASSFQDTMAPIRATQRFVAAFRRASAVLMEEQ